MLQEKKELTNLQKDFIAKNVCLDDKGRIIFASKDPNEKYEVLFHTLVNEKTKDFKVPAEMFHKNMREWITQLLIKSPYGKIFTNPQGNVQQDLDTYNEMCALKPEEMEWGVVQKCISMMLIANVDFFTISKEVENAYHCAHTPKGEEMLSYKTCEKCYGLGYVMGKTPKPTMEEIVLKNYNTIINQCKEIQMFILDRIICIKEECLLEIWYEKMTHTERFNANGEIAKANPKTMRQQPNLIHAS